MEFLNRERMAQAFVQLAVKRIVRDKVNPLLEALGQERLEWLISNNRPISAFIPQQFTQQLATLGEQYGTYAALVSDDFCWSCLPKWVQSTVESAGTAGTVWKQQNLAWLRDIMSKKN